MWRELIIRCLFFKFLVPIILVLRSWEILPELWVNNRERKEEKFLRNQSIEPRRAFTSFDFENSPMVSRSIKILPDLCLVSNDREEEKIVRNQLMEPRRTFTSTNLGKRPVDRSMRNPIIVVTESDWNCTYM